MAISLRHRIIGAGLTAVAASRADLWLAPLARGLGAILTFHHVRPQRADGFRPNALLEITPEHLDGTLELVRRLGLEIVPLDAVPDRLTRGEGGFVALTFDDGYRDNRDHALPVLRRHGAPWTMFVTTDFASGRGSLWWVELEEAIRASDRIVFDGRVLPCGTSQEKDAAFAALYADLRAGPEPRLREATARLCEEAGIDRARLVPDLCLSWSELDALAASENAPAIGAHTLTHPMLARWDEATARREITEPKAAIEEKLGSPVRHLAYPVGDPGSAGFREFAIAREAGYATAVTTRPGHLFAGHAAHLTALPRVSINGLYQTEAATRALLSGVPFLAWNRGRRLNVG
ncbi:polysaccharide deacetylase family protein [Enterovirga rhinocerotis]|uniref:Chitooligosaccharide deacetylase n=1 Tax=Enterovirga rhinocerotis TaxID=1339210 RepID=A0A4R7C818_9HYPH|nr:polysaccharide deacetylase family protein [Enterovirga rhinocerotis]TDR94343.1 polysaccharide deacetylase [Enterovirga rhinocerotis]